jgi:hypothetical protein
MGCVFGIAKEIAGNSYRWRPGALAGVLQICPLQRIGEFGSGAEKSVAESDDFDKMAQS